MAGGVSLLRENLPRFRAKLNELARRRLRSDQLQAPLRLDAQAALRDLDQTGVEELARLEQTGTDNPSVQLWSSRLCHAQRPQRIGQQKQHVKFWVTDGAEVREAVWWRADGAELPGETFDLAFQPRLNQFRGRVSVQLKVLDWRACSGPRRSPRNGT